MDGLHAVTCSYFISSCYRLGKTKRLNLLRKNNLLPDPFVLLGEENNQNKRTIEAIERFICEFYGKQITTELNDACYQMFCEKRKSPDPDRTRPIRDNFMLHLKRVNL